MASRFYVPAGILSQREAVLPDAVAHHALRVLRLKEGETVILFDGQGGEAAGQLQVTGKQCVVTDLCFSDVERESPLRLVLVQALATGDKMDWVVQKAVELGAAGVIPVHAVRSVLKLSGERAARRVDHWRQIAIAACEQCGRNRIPFIGDIVDLPSYLSMPSVGVSRMMLAPGGTPLKGLSMPQDEIHILIGPEGGWNESELKMAERAGCMMTGVGPRVLRTETAGLAMLAAMQTRWGDF